jgi:hypothetical protein
MGERCIATNPREDDRITRDGTTVMVDRVADGWVYFSRWRDGQMYIHADLVRVPLADWTRLVEAETPAAAGAEEEGGRHG